MTKDRPAHLRRSMMELTVKMPDNCWLYGGSVHGYIRPAHGGFKSGRRSGKTKCKRYYLKQIAKRRARKGYA